VGIREGQTVLTVSVNGPLIVDDLDVVIRAAVDGVGLAFMDGEHVANRLASGALVRVLEDGCQPCPSGSGRFWLASGRLRLEPRRGNSKIRYHFGGSGLFVSAPAATVSAIVHGEA
jgi:DNA-binding transcriptional LysR family regulator